MKRNIIAISLMAAGLFTFGNVYAEEAATISKTSCNTTYQAALSDGTSYLCGSSLQSLIGHEKFDGGEVTLLKDMNEGITTTVTIKKSATINLNGHKLIIGNSGKIVVDGTSVTIKNGTITTGTNNSAMFDISSTTKEASLTIGDDVKVNSTAASLGAAIHIADSTNNKVIVNVNGKWTIPGELVDCENGDENGNIIVNLNANVTSDIQLVSIDAGTSTVNVLGGSYTSKSQNAIKLQNGTLNISGGKIVATKGSAVYVDKSEENLARTINITGGELIANGDQNFAVKFKDETADGEYSFSGGIYTSGKDSKGEFQPAMYIGDADFLDKQQGIITGGTYNHGIVGDVSLGKNIYQPAASAIKTLVGTDLTYTEGEDGTITVAPAKTEEQPTNPEQTGSQAGSDDGSNTGDNTPDDSPQTYDGIMSYVTMALTSVGAVALSLKKVLSR